MKLEKLFKIQSKLDRDIVKAKDLDPNDDFMDHRILALLVEIGEMANETRCFKFWSNKPASKKEVILEEYVDCMHFILSIGNYSGFASKACLFSMDRTIKGSLIELMEGFFLSVSDFRNGIRLLNYIKIWDYFFSIGKQLGFTEPEIFHAYIEKNIINHKRQEEGY